MSYEEQLQTKEWKAKREEILERDWHMCQVCMSSKNLQVHHKKYISGLLAWEYDNFYLKTLCEDCHKKEHGLFEYPNLSPVPQKSLRERLNDLYNG